MCYKSNLTATPIMLHNHLFNINTTVTQSLLWRNFSVNPYKINLYETNPYMVSTTNLLTLTGHKPYKSTVIMIVPTDTYQLLQHTPTVTQHPLLTTTKLPYWDTTPTGTQLLLEHNFSYYTTNFSFWAQAPAQLNLNSPIFTWCLSFP